ncbi:EamA family transporter [Candidatus Woesearchaeota archaeon]|nr:EamA family transporter [Candidatus Woesearchaeota archaeon]
MVKIVILLVVLIATFIGAVASFLTKKGSHQKSWKELIWNRYIWCGFILYGVSTLAYIYSLRFEQLTILYPLVSTAYIWTTLFAVKFLGEKMNGWKWLGLAGIILGVVFIGLGS